MMAGPLATSFRGLWVSGLLPPGNGDPKTDHAIQGTTRTPGWHPEETTSYLPLVSKRYSRTSAGVAPRRGDPKTCVKRKGPENPGVAAPLAAAGCRGNCWCAGRVFRVARRWTMTSRSAYVLYGVWLQARAVCMYRELRVRCWHLGF